ncbi:DUF4011 domain-containing protein [Duganella sp. CY15W]|uniref:AAA domain-containing protein n=1 Tax=Duganella sp. CY15W TaxID=2692172 RepID=UPI00136CFC84|nr:AAA domain-containing protein [Duganella sp. CY15W]MYM29529.1 DUF4011 domain-containing protein [Duganella sp. CY15W]
MSTPAPVFFDFLNGLHDAPQTEDLQAWLLPLFEQVAQLHAQDQVAPLKGVASVRFDYNQLWFEQGLAPAPQRADDKIAALDPQSTLTISARLYQDDEETRNLRIAALQTGTGVEAPAYLPGYVSWEHTWSHHDPLTDIFVLGLMLASAACRLNLSQEEDLARFVAHRHNLFALNDRLNPVWARMIVRMTELSRHRREPDLQEVIHTLRNYRVLDAPVALPAVAQGEGSRNRQLQAHLRDRLFEVSRRNKLLYFRQSQQTLNLTVGSFPLMLDVRNIKEEQLFYWHEDVAKQVCSEAPIPLQKYLRFEDLPFLPSQLDAIRTAAQRDQNEYGCSQLRLAVCMLRWHNFKEDKNERITTPLLLLPVTLTRKKGVRDTYQLQATTSVAEVNPVLRHVLRQVYGMELPETVDLEQPLDAFHAQLEQQIRQSEPGITLHKIERPQIQVIRKLAKARLDQFERRRKKQLSGLARRSHGDFEYSYDKSAYHPLGVQLFLDRVKPQPAPLANLVGKPRPLYMTAPGVVEGETYVIDEDRAGSPYDWEFDLCALTLGNFNYRKMSLVQDYNALLRENLSSPAFDGIFSLEPRRSFADTVEQPDLARQFTVVPQDPTQARAITHARSGASMIIQGPPGTGKSQTITNLIADYVARGKRIMFVCEKRAAIDVVYHRLQQHGLEKLCALIHDSQGDKKAFVMDLKACYEAWMAPVSEPEQAEHQRNALLALAGREQEQLAAFSSEMTATYANVGIPLRDLYKRIAILGVDEGASVSMELPDYAQWAGNGAMLLDLAARLRDAGQDPVLAHHPLRNVHPQLLATPQPVAAVRAAAAEALPLLQQLQSSLSALPAELWQDMAALRRLAGYLHAVRPLLQRQLPELLDADLPRSAAFLKLRKQYLAQREAVVAATDKSAHWRVRPTADEVEIALPQAAAVEQKLLGFLSPVWWQLRRLFKSAYDMGAHAVKPRWSDCLRWLQQDYQATAALAAVQREIDSEWHVDDVDAFSAQVEALHAQNAALPPALLLFQRELTSRRHADLAGLVELEHLCTVVFRALDAGWVDFDHLSVPQLLDQLEATGEASAWLPLMASGLTALHQTPAAFAHAARTWPGQPEALELAMARASLAQVYRDNAALSRQSGAQLDQLCAQLSAHLRELHALNARVILERRRNQFLAQLAIANSSASQLSAEQKEFKKNYSAGRRELENEFSKVMRYKAIRELASSHSGLVVRDLKPVWMMSPLSISDTLPLEADYFDVVIFDEASQIPVEEAIPSLYRGPQVIVVGDEMQLPPTNFFSAQHDPDDADEEMMADLSSDSFLNQAARSLPSTMLQWHYRSRSEALITFSNHRFYEGSLLTIPDHALMQPAAPIVMANGAEVAPALAQALQRPISFHFLSDGLYRDRRNQPEAAYIAQLVRQLLASGSPLTLGVVAFSEAQQDEIVQALRALASADAGFSTLLDAAYEREEDGQFCGLFIKNLENVQGDERDLIIMSVCYGYDAQRKMLMNFGPINRAGGEKRLNVVFSRAKRHMFLVSSVKHTDIRNDYNPGAFALKAYLQFAELSSIGDQPGARQVIELLGGKHRVRRQTEHHPVVVRLQQVLQQRGYLVDTDIGESSLRCDLGVRRQGDSAYRLGILVDTDTHYAAPDLIERYLQQPDLLSGAGWRIARVYSKDWVARREAVLDELFKTLDA